MPNLNPNGLIFSTVSTFVEQVGRRRTWKYGELDTLVCTFTGPTALATQFKPNVNSPHPDYPLMFCTDSQIINQAALIAEIQATYRGIIQSNGASKYITPPITTETPVQGSRDFIYPWYTSLGNELLPVPVQGQPLWAAWTSVEMFNFGTQSLTLRYVGVQCSIRYQAYPRPTSLHYSNLGLGRVSWFILSRLLGPVTTVGKGNINQVNQFLLSVPKVPPLFGSNLGFNIEQQGKWYNCVEIYGPTF